MPYCFLVSLTGFLLLVSSTQSGISLGLDSDYTYLHIHGNKADAAGTTLQAAFVLLVPALLSGYLLLRSSPDRALPAYLTTPGEIELAKEESKQPNAAFDSATAKTPLLSRD